MRTVLAASALMLFVSLAILSQGTIHTEELSGVLPDGVRVEQFTLSADGQRTYYTTASGDVWLYDRGSKHTSRIPTGNVWDLALSPSRDSLAYTKVGETRRQQYVWVLPVDPKSGLASGNERRLSEHTGDAPSISPDGKSVAFARDDATGVGQSVVVVPLSGGAERLVAATQPSSVSSIRWTPDGKTLYFGLNTPVPFTCAESCLSVPGGNPQIPGTIRRVAVAGGAVETVVTTGNPSPGLSPDGTRLVFQDTGGNRQFVVADTNGRRLSTFTLPAIQAQQGWSSNSTMLTISTGNVRRLSIVPRTGVAPARVLYESDSAAPASALSPDGKMISLLRTAGNDCELRIMNADGGLQKTITLPDPGCGDSLTWTPDQRRLIYTQYLPPDRRTAIKMVDIATGQATALRENRPGEVNWVVDSNAVILSEIPAAEPQRHVSFWQVDFDGKSTLLSDLPFDETAGSFAAPIDRSTGMIWRGGRELHLISLAGSASERVISPAQSGSFLPPAISADHQWVAFRINPTENAAAELTTELVRLDGSARRTITLPFAALNLLILPGATELIVTARPAPNAVPGVYLFNAETGSARKLFDYVLQGRLPSFALSPDGLSLFVLSTEAARPTVSAMDFSQIR